MTRQFKTAPAPHLPPATTVSKVMTQVLLALIPGIALYSWYFGSGVLIQIFLAVCFACLFESLMLLARGRLVKPALLDGSAAVTAVLFALCIPPLAPWWISFIGMMFAMVVAKHLFGGLGHNVFNPAMVGYVVVLISFPATLTQWLPPRGLLTLPDFQASLHAVFTGQLPGALSLDAISRATPLDALKTGLETGAYALELRENPIFGQLGALGWEWIALAYAAGGSWLLWRKVISWQVPLATIITLVAVSMPFWLLDPGTNPSPVQHLVSGALILGAFFIATDPVSGCASPRGRLIFGAGVAILTLVIRRWGGYPDGVAFAVLLMNMAAPLIDRYTRPGVYGR